MIGAPVRRQHVAFTLKRGLSQRRECALLSTSRSTLHYEPCMEVRDGPLIVAMTGLAAQYPRYGYRRIQVFMEHQGHVMGPDRAYGLWSKAGLQAPKKRPRKRVAQPRPRPQLPAGANKVWAYDFVVRCLRKRAATEMPDGH